MRKLILASVSGVALLGLAACSDSTDGTTTQAIPDQDPMVEQPAQPVVPPAEPAQPTEPAQPAVPAE